jgi:hypothetical protein
VLSKRFDEALRNGTLGGPMGGVNRSAQVR